jgi:cystathionine beta-lyase/cystathionine gamma-synthase
LAAKDPKLCDQIYFIQNAEGGALGPFDCWLCLRGLKTMSLRMEKQAANCERMVRGRSTALLAPLRPLPDHSACAGSRP